MKSVSSVVSAPVRTAFLVVGMHRSGTSAVTRTLGLLGAALPGDLLEPGPVENPTGFWESASIVANHDRFLAAVGSGWDDPLPLPPHVFATAAAAECQDEIVAILRRQVAGADAFVIKDPRLCRVLPLWRAALTSMKVRPVAVLPLRDPGAIALSLRVRNGFSRSKSLALWLTHMVQAEQATRDWTRRFVRYDDFLADPVAAAQALAAQLGLDAAVPASAPWDEIRRYWSHDLRHHVVAEPQALPAWGQDLHDWLHRAAAGLAPDPAPLDRMAAGLAGTWEFWAPLWAEMRQESSAQAARSQSESAALRHGLDQAMTTRRQMDEAMTALRHQYEQKAAALCAVQREDGANRAALDALQREDSANRAALAALQREDSANRAALAALQREDSANRAALAALRREDNANRAALSALRQEETVRQGVLAAAQSEIEWCRAEIDRLNRQACKDLQAIRQDLAQERDWMTRLLRRRSVLDWLPGGHAVRHVAQAAALLPRLLRPGLFDADYYRRRCPQAGGFYPKALLHYLLIGRLRGIGPNGLFDPAYYLARQRDVAVAGRDPLLHYLRRGAGEGRKPSALFDGAEYLARNPDVARAGINPLRHYLRHGWREGRDPNAYFDLSYYQAQTPAKGEALTHYAEWGAAQGLRPSALFDGTQYWADNPDVRAAGLNPLAHYLDCGRAEGRDLPAAPLAPPVAAGARPQRILLVLHGLGGGVLRHCRDLDRLLTAQAVDVWWLESVGAGSYRLSNGAAGAERGYEDGDRLLSDLRALHLDLVHVHHDMGFGSALWRWLAQLAVPYHVTLHDYAMACPRVTLLGDDNRFCGQELDSEKCDACVARNGAHPHLQALFDQVGGVARWRQRATAILAGAERVYVPDGDVAARLARYFPACAVVVRPHPEPRTAIIPPPPVPGPRVRVAILGNIGPHKGFDVLLACAKAARRDNLNLTFVVLGTVCDPEALAGLDNVEMHGAYQVDELPSLLRQAHCHVAAFLSVWPETFTYTLSEAWRAGLYPLVFDLGAPARRVRQLGWGEVLPCDASPQQINARLHDAALDHPVPSSRLMVGQEYPCLLRDYYGLSPRTP